MYFKRFVRLVVLFLLLFLLNSVVVLATPGLNHIVLAGQSDVTQAVDELKNELLEQGFTIPLIVNHSAAAASVDLQLVPNQVIYARPRRQLEKKLLRKSPTIGIDLPVKFHVYEDNGDIVLAVNSIGYLIDRHSMTIKDSVLRVTNHLINQFGTQAQTGLLNVISQRNVDETVQALQQAISANPDARIPLVLDYSVFDQSKAGSRKRNKPAFSPVLIVFGNPNVGTFLMQSNPAIGIDLPLEFLVWKNDNDTVTISYTDPQFLKQRFQLTDQDARINAIANALQNLASQGAGL